MPWPVTVYAFGSKLRLGSLLYKGLWASGKFPFWVMSLLARRARAIALARLREMFFGIFLVTPVVIAIWPSWRWSKFISIFVAMLL